MEVNFMRVIFPWRRPQESPATVTSPRDDVTTCSPLLPNKVSDADRLPFWRRLLCAPELPDMNLQAVSLQRGATHTSRSRPPSIVTPVPVSNADAATAIANGGKGGGSLAVTKSVFAGSWQRAAPADNDGSVQPDSFLSTGTAPAPAARWAVSDTRRMQTKTEDWPGSCLTPPSPSSRVGSPLARMRLKQARSEQMKMEARQQKELQRDEEVLWAEEEQRRLHAVARETTCDASSSVTLSGELLAQHKTQTEEGAYLNGLVNSHVESVGETDDESSYIDGDDAIDLQDLNRLYEYYKRRDRAVESSGQEAAVTDASIVASPDTTNRKRARSYELSSRKYIERVVLAQRSQQMIALMWLLAESMRHAWKLHFRLAQLYVTYVPLYLQAGVGAVDNGEEINLPDITKSKYYAYFCSGTFDYEYYMYEFSHKWETLFGDAQHYLSDNTTGPSGSVGVAATLLYSMELFERHHELQVAVREVEQWLQARWRRMNEAAVLALSPTTTANMATPPNDDGDSISGSSGPPPTAAHGDSACEDGAPQLVRLASSMGVALHAVSAGREEEEEEMTYIPIDWWGAQDVDVRAHVSWNRKRRKFRQIRLGMAALRRANPLESPDGIARSPQDPAPQMQPWLPVALEPVMEDGSDEEAQPHRVVNVGCFGFSFFSRWD